MSGVKIFFKNPTVYAALLLLCALFFLYWPLALFGLALLIFFGRIYVGILCALFFDVLWGPPVGNVHVFVLPITCFVLCLVLLRAIISPYLRPRQRAHV